MNGKRMTQGEYTYVKKEICEKLGELEIEHAVPRELPGKESYGDLDIVFVPKPGGAKISDAFEHTEIVHNGDVTSLRYRDTYQIDFIKCDSVLLNCAWVYFSYGDLGAILGYICSHHGLRYGSEGLWTYVYEVPGDRTTAGEKVTLSCDASRIFEFLGLSMSRFQAGFDSLEQIFDFALSCKYFTPSVFDHLNCDHRKRNSKRPMYQKFIQYISGLPEVPPLPRFPSVCAINDALVFFDQEKSYSETVDKLNMRRAIKEKFSGKLFLPYACGKDIGTLMESFRLHIGEGFNSYVLASTSDQVAEAVNLWWGARSSGAC